MQYNMSKVIGLTHNKTAHIIARDGFEMTGFVLTHPDGRKCIVDMSAVRWFHDTDGKAFFGMMHPNETPSNNI
jgi:hypothetical protein